MQAHGNPPPQSNNHVSFVHNDRLYLNVNQADKTKIVNGQLKGAGIKAYSKPIGALLELMGWAKEYESSDKKKVYVNTNSLAKYTIRLLEAEKTGKTDNPKNAKSMPELINDLYKTHKGTGYDQSKIDEFKQTLHETTVRRSEIQGFINNKLQVAELKPNLKSLVDDLEPKYYEEIKELLDGKAFGSDKDTLKDNIKTTLGRMISEIEKKLNPEGTENSTILDFRDESDDIEIEEELNFHGKEKLTVPEKNFILNDVFNKFGEEYSNTTELSEAVTDLRKMSVKEALDKAGRVDL